MNSVEQAGQSIGEALNRVELGGPLLDIDNLQDFLYQRLSRISFVPTRIEVLVSEITKIRDRHRPLEDGPVEDLDAARQQALVQAFMGSALVLGHNLLYENFNRAGETRKTNQTHEQLLRSIAAGKDLQDQVQTYIELFGDAPGDQLYDGLRVMLDDSRRLIYNDPNLPEWTVERHATILNSLLAETKVVRSLRTAGWAYTHHSSVDMDAHHQVDVVVPAMNGHDQVVYLQVKHRKKLRSELMIGGRNEPVPDIRVPMHPATNHPFDLTSQETAKLSEFVAWRAAA